MAKKYTYVGIFLTVFGMIGSLYSMTFDNRFIPWYPRPFFKTLSHRSNLQANGFFLTANSAYGDEVKEKIGIPEIYGKFNQKVLGQALVLAGLPNPLRPVWQLVNKIEWNVLGKIQGQGLALQGECAITERLSLGGSGNFLHLSSNQQFVIPNETKRSLGLTAADEQELDRERREMLQSLGLDQSRWATSSITDTELYLRYGWAGEYILKSRKADLSFVLGAFFPTGVKRDINNQSSIPFSGDGLMGVVWGADFTLELKEDWWFNLMAKFLNRFSKIQEQRLSVDGEPIIFGATTGRVEVNPGFTGIISPTARLEDIQEGVGLQFQYVYAFHRGDVWTDMRENKMIPVKLSQIYTMSEWRSEYLLFSAFFDHSRVRPDKKLRPVFDVSMDIPLKIFGPKDAAKTWKFSFGVAFRF